MRRPDPHAAATSPRDQRARAARAIAERPPVIERTLLTLSFLLCLAVVAGLVG